MKIGLFSSQSFGTLNFDGFKNEDPPEGINGYERPCSGDSGSGHWITEEGATGVTGRAIVVAIHTASQKPCGNAWPPGSYTGATLMKTTNQVIHKWIKEKAEI